MKKFTILTSVLALTACGGGSGGGQPGAIVNPSLTDEQRTAAEESNANLTNMKSFIIVGGSNPTVNPNSRQSGVQMADGGVMYDLENVEFKTASMLLNTSIDDSAIIKFKTTNGVVDEITMSVEGINDENEQIDLKINSRRHDNTSVFNEHGTLSFKVNGVEESDPDEFSTFELLYKSGARDTGLSYSDFGVVQWGESGNYDTSNYFAGGYDVKRTDTNNGAVDYTRMNELAQNSADGKLTFTGKADGVVRIGSMSDDADTHYTANNKLDLSTTANLEFANGTTTLTANFDNWYDVTATMDSTGKLVDLRFANGNKEGFYHSDNYDFKWRRDGNSQNTHIAEPTRNIDLGTPENPDRSETVITDGFVQYYGDNGNPAEAVGVIKHGDSLHESGAMRFDMGFGGTRQ